MRERIWIVAISIVGLTLFNIGCDSGGGGGIGPIILITNQWRNEANPDHTFDLNSFDDNRPEGAFIGQETRPRAGFAEFNDLAGFWSDGEIQFTINRPEGPVRYRGEFEEEDAKRLEFTSSQGALVIVRD